LLLNYKMFTIKVFLHDNRIYNIPMMRDFLSEYVDPTGIVNPEGIKFLTSQFYFLNQINYAILKCYDYKTLFMLYAYSTSFRDSISFYTLTKTIKLNEVSRIFNHTHISKDNMLTPDGTSLVFGPGIHCNASIRINNYNTIYRNYYAYCYAHTTPPPTHQSITTFQYNTTFPTTPKKHKSDEELVCPDAPKKPRRSILE
jgi:hypothetical protein